MLGCSSGVFFSLFGERLSVDYCRHCYEGSVLSLVNCYYVIRMAKFKREIAWKEFSKWIAGRVIINKSLFTRCIHIRLHNVVEDFPFSLDLSFK